MHINRKKKTFFFATAIPIEVVYNTRCSNIVYVF